MTRHSSPLPIDISRLDRICLSGLRLDALIGVLPEERLATQPVLIDLVLYQLPSPATQTDCLDHTVSYAAVYERVRDLTIASRFSLVERLAGELAKVLLVEFPRLLAVAVSVFKPKAPLPGPFESAGYCIQRSRADYGLGSTVDLSLGANLGDRLDTLREAVRQISDHPQIEQLAVSSVYETTPVGLVDQPDFLNLVLRIRTTLDPFALLSVCQQIESQLGRQRTVRWGPRTIDIDLLTFGSMVSAAPDLTLPHPRMQDRDFVQIPLNELETGRAQPTPDVRLACKLG
jgi:dihydroneopterin aldolase/2-amino-4-hydroxy-6-hydroxymethyldihydropteridine diphosphokinase